MIAAVAMQTKYTALIIPPVLAWYGITHRKTRFAVVAVGVATVMFAAWELMLTVKYGQSHFLYHLQSQQPAGGEGNPLARFVNEKADLLAPLAGHLGCLAVGIGLFAGRGLGIPRGVLVAVAACWCVGFGLIAALPHHDTILIHGKKPGHEKLALAAAVWRTTGTLVLLTAAGAAAVLTFRRRTWTLRRDGDTWFVVGWLVLEVLGYFALTPFPAARRVIGVTVAVGVLAARFVSRTSRANPDRRPPRWVVPFGVLAGVLVAALDTYDALPEKVYAGRSAAVVRERSPDARVWYVGHWGFSSTANGRGCGRRYPGGRNSKPATTSFSRPTRRTRVLPPVPRGGVGRDHAAGGYTRTGRGVRLGRPALRPDDPELLRRHRTGRRPGPPAVDGRRVPGRADVEGVIE